MTHDLKVLQTMRNYLYSMTAWLFVLCLLCAAGGCNGQKTNSSSSSDISPTTITGPADLSSSDKEYAPVEIEILPLTELVQHGKDNQKRTIKAYVSLLDSAGSQVKTPCVFRFELYNKVSRSARPKGRRIAVWPDIDVVEMNKNNEYWRDFLRAYKFDLELKETQGQNFILQVTTLCLNGRRLSDDFEITTGK